MSLYWENVSYPKFKTSVCLTLKTLRKKQNIRGVFYGVNLIKFNQKSL